MKTNSCVEIYAYWNDLRGKRQSPLRSEIDPTQIRHLLPDLFVLTEGDGDALSFRLTGTRLYNLFFRELRGSAFSSIWQEEDADYASRLAGGVMSHERPMLLALQGETVSGLTTQTFEMLLLPLQAEPHFPTRLLGALVSDRPLADFGQPYKPLALVDSQLVEPFQPHHVVEDSRRKECSIHPFVSLREWPLY